MMPPFDLQDTLNLLSKMTARRFWNGLKVLTSYQLSKWIRKPWQWGFPLAIAFEPTTSCNLRCPECPSGLRAFSRPTGMLDQALFRKTIDELAKEVLYLNFYFQGEPFLHPDFLEMVRYASRKKIYTATSTNAHFLDEGRAKHTVESGLDRLIISLDGTTQEIYQQYRIGGKLDRVLEGTRRVVYWKKKLHSKTPFLIFQFLVVRPNEHQIQDARDIAKSIGVDQIRFKTAQVYDYQRDPNRLIPLNTNFSRYRSDPQGIYQLKNTLLNHCWRLWHAPVITWDGMVVPCCFDKDAKHRMGDIKSLPLKEIWRSDDYVKFRKRLLHGRRNIDICANCSEGTKVWSGQG